MSDHLEANRELITAWMEKKRAEVPIPFYGSVDVRGTLDGRLPWLMPTTSLPDSTTSPTTGSCLQSLRLMGTHIKRNYGDCSVGSSLS